MDTNQRFRSVQSLSSLNAIGHQFRQAVKLLYFVPIYAYYPFCLSTDFVTNSNCTPDHEPSYDSSPTETCVCVHCFPDLKALGQANDRLPSAPFSYYPPVLHRAQIQNGGPVWAEGNLYTSGQEVQEEAAVG